MSSPRGGTEVDQWRGEGKEDEGRMKVSVSWIRIWGVMTVRCNVSG